MELRLRLAEHLILVRELALLAGDLLLDLFLPVVQVSDFPCDPFKVVP